jgi:hypothetical protein
MTSPFVNPNCSIREVITKTTMRTVGGSSLGVVAAAAVCVWTIAAAALTASAFVPPSPFGISYTRSVARAAAGSTASTASSHRRNATVVEVVAPLNHRFERTASRIQHVDQPCIITIDGVRYNVTAWGTYAFDSGLLVTV